MEKQKVHLVVVSGGVAESLDREVEIIDLDNLRSGDAQADEAYWDSLSPQAQDYVKKWHSDYYPES